jgi:hypothetical protein
MILRSLLFSFFIFASVANPCVANVDKQYIAQVNGRIQVRANGTLAGVSLNNVTSNELRIFLEEQIKKWQFHPMTVDEKPVDADTAFNFQIIASFSPDKKLSKIAFQDITIEPTDFELKVQNADKNKSAYSEKRVVPRYPERALIVGAMAEVLVAVKISPDGSILQAAPYRVALLGVGHKLIEADSRLLSSQFTSSAVSAIKKWRISQANIESQDCVAGCVSLIKVSYTLDSGPWLSYFEINVPEVTWVKEWQVQSDISKPKSQLVRFKEQPSSQPIDAGG